MWRSLVGTLPATTNGINTMNTDKTLRAFQITVRRSIFESLNFLLVEKHDSLQVTRFNLQDNTTAVRSFKYDFDPMMESMIAWRNGDLVQTAFPYMNRAEREWLMTADLLDDFFSNVPDEDI